LPSDFKCQFIALKSGALILYSKQHKPRRKMVGVLDNLNKGQVQPLFQAAPAGGS
jgi:hypothetical protein